MSLQLLDVAIRAGMDAAIVLVPCMLLSGAAVLITWRMRP